MTLPYIKLVVPTALTKFKNGQLPANVLGKIKTGGLMYAPVAEQFNKMYDAALAAGHKLRNVGDYRSFESQLAMFRDRYVLENTGTGVTRTYEGKTWYLHTGAPVATPGTSNHGWGLAIDVALRVDGRAVPISCKPEGAWRSGLQFLRKMAPDLGWSWELQSEPWHIRYVLGRRLG